MLPTVFLQKEWRWAAARSATSNAMKSVLADLAGYPGLAAAVDVARRLPPPRYSDEAWAIAQRFWRYCRRWPPT